MAEPRVVLEACVQALRDALALEPHVSVTGVKLDWFGEKATVDVQTERETGD